VNIFVLDENPYHAAHMHCDKHIPKMVVEHLQMCGSAVIRHGATPDMMPLTKKGTPLKGGYHNHPCTVWAGDSQINFAYAVDMGIALAKEYTFRFGKTHFCEAGLRKLKDLTYLMPVGTFTPFAIAIADHMECRKLPDFDNMSAVEKYRAYYIHDKKHFATWNKGRVAPEWWSHE
jgi:hypothetical protein